MKNSFSKILLIFLLFACSSRFYPKVAGTKVSVVNQDVKSDSSIDDLIEPYKLKLQSKMNRVLGYSKIEISKNNDGESTLGNFVSDAIFSKINQNYVHKVDLAAVNNGGLRSALPKGPITVGNVYELMPFENELVVLTLTGSQTLKYFEFQASKKTHIANTKVLVDKMTNIPKQVLIGNMVLDTTKKYSIAMSDFMASNEPNWLKDIPRTSTSILIRDLIIEKIEKSFSVNDSLNPKIEGRLIFE